jgi:hypothetical protein
MASRISAHIPVQEKKDVLSQEANDVKKPDSSNNSESSLESLEKKEAEIVSPRKFTPRTRERLRLRAIKENADAEPKATSAPSQEKIDKYD